MKGFQRTVKKLASYSPLVFAYQISSASFSLRFPKTGKIREIGMVLRFNFYVVYITLLLFFVLIILIDFKTGLLFKFYVFYKI